MQLKKIIDIDAMSKVDWKEAFKEELSNVWKAKYFFLLVYILIMF